MGKLSCTLLLVIALIPTSACVPVFGNQQDEARHAYAMVLRGFNLKADDCTHNLVGRFRFGTDASTSHVRFEAPCGGVAAFLAGARMKLAGETDFPRDGGYDPPNWWAPIACEGLLVAVVPVRREHHRSYLAQCPGNPAIYGYARYVD
jgi:hypothetical protein